MVRRDPSMIVGVAVAAAVLMSDGLVAEELEVVVDGVRDIQRRH